MDIAIRQVLPKDLDTAAKIELLCFEASEAATRESIENRIKQYPEGFLVAEVDGIIAGYINSGATNDGDITDEAFKGLVGHDPEGRNIVVFALAVSPQYQNKGISKVLMTHFIQRSCELKKENILLLCKDNLIDYYQKLGFEHTGPSKSKHGGFDWHEMSYKLL